MTCPGIVILKMETNKLAPIILKESNLFHIILQFPWYGSRSIKMAQGILALESKHALEDKVSYFPTIGSDEKVECLDECWIMKRDWSVGS